MTDRKFPCRTFHRCQNENRRLIYMYAPIDFEDVVPVELDRDQPIRLTSTFTRDKVAIEISHICCYTYELGCQAEIPQLAAKISFVVACGGLVCKIFS